MSPEVSLRTGRTRDHQRLERSIRFFFPFLVLLVIVFVGACASTTDEAGKSSEAEVRLAPASQLSDQVKQAPPVVQEAYRFAIANQEILEKVPCYCGCGNMGHMSNLECFVDEFNPDGSIVFDYHALG